MLEGTGAGPYRRRLRYDREFYFELKTCKQYQIKHSDFLAWDPDDQAKALAFEIEEAQHCQMCGTAGWEWDDAEGGSRFAYEAVEHFCHGCYLLAAGHTHDPNRNTDGITVELAPARTVEAARRHLKMAARERADRA